MSLFVVSNRLPVTVTENAGRLQFQQSMGGLVSGLSAYLDSLKNSRSTDRPYIWVGWPGISVTDSLQQTLKEQLYSENNALPVFLPEKTMDQFYHGFCNKTIWPLFHYFPSYTTYDEDYWHHYQKVNTLFAEAVLEMLKPKDTLWIHDYHLMLLPRLIREKRPDVSIGFFLHIPFPSFEIFRLLPMKWRSRILEGLLGADLVGFHTHDYTQYFLGCVQRILGFEHTLGEMMIHGRKVKADTFPMGIDFQKFNAAAADPKTEQVELKQKLPRVKIVLSVDRLDYTKGIANRLEGFSAFLEKNPDWRGKVVLLLVVVPSRVGVERYQQMKRQIDEKVGAINGQWGVVGWTPVVYQYSFVPFFPLVGMYAASDVALVTPLRDGMNLIAKEYVASQRDRHGVLVLSEMAGAAKELGEAILINPNNREEIADAIREALEMPAEEQSRRLDVMQKRLQRYTVTQWANHFLDELTSVKKDQQRLEVKQLSPAKQKQLMADFRASQKRLLFLDYDGTLVPFAKEPHLAVPTAEVTSILRHLGKTNQCEVVLISGRDKNILEQWFGSLPIHLVGEHGVWIREKGRGWNLLKPVTNDWKPKLLPILEMASERLPGSMVEEKEYSLVWHYRNADPEAGPARAKELMDDLVNYTANIDVQVLQGHKVVEIKNAGIHKGTAGLHFVQKYPADFVMAIGDDWTDEDLFNALSKYPYTVRVGIAESAAHFNLNDHSEVLTLLGRLE